MRVRMISQISGGRADGRDWPDPRAEGGGMIEVSDFEGADLVRGGMAEPGDNFAADTLREMGVEVPDRAGEPAADAEPADREAEPAEAAEPGPAAAEPAAAADEAAEAGPSASSAPESEPEPVPLVPAPADLKQAWIDYAVSQGEDPDTARDMTKADLMSKYGSRL